LKNSLKLTSRVGLVLIFAFGSIATRAQSKMIKTIFKLLPPAFIYELTDITRDSMLEGKTYYPSENDSNAVLAFNYGGSTFVNDYLYVSMAYETSQRGTGMVEIRGFKLKEKDLIIVSGTGGVEGVNYQQQDISAFIYDRESGLISYKAKIFPDWSVDLFLKSGVPDPVKKEMLSNANLIFDFSNTNVFLSLKSSFLLDNQLYRKWLNGDCIRYKWTGKRFKAGPAHFSD
jgi:hypothetical protein